MSENLQNDLEGVNEEFYRHALKLISDGLICLNLEGKFLFFNDSAQAMMATRWEKGADSLFWDLAPDDYFGFSMKEALKFGIAHKLLYQSRPPKEFEITTTFVYDGPKKEAGLIICFRDISEKQKLQSALTHANRLKGLGEMTARITHEIRNPLGGIRGYASLLSRDLRKEKPLQEMAELILKGTQSLEQLLSTVLQYARPIQVIPQTVDIALFLKQVIKFVKVDPACPPLLKWDLHIPDAPLLAPIDSAALRSALLNLLFNAFQAMPEGGVLSCSLLYIDPFYQISISDTGIGMSDDALKHLFSPFFTTKVQGNGLGLVEVEKVIQAHHGRIDVRSTVGKGTTFTLTLPLRR